MQVSTVHRTACHDVDCHSHPWVCSLQDKCFFSCLYLQDSKCQENFIVFCYGHQKETRLAENILVSYEVDIREESRKTGEGVMFVFEKARNLPLPPNKKQTNNKAGYKLCSKSAAQQARHLICWRELLLVRMRLQEHKNL